MPRSGGFSYVVQGRCSLIHYPEFRMLKAENSTALGNWIFQDILCRWGALGEIVTDNGAPFLKALAYCQNVITSIILGSAGIIQGQTE